MFAVGAAASSVLVVLVGRAVGTLLHVCLLDVLLAQPSCICVKDSFLLGSGSTFSSIKMADYRAF